MKTMLLQLAVVVAFSLATTLPFINQPFSVDGPLVLDFAETQAEDPLQQHIDDFDYFGIRYDEFHDTHPRLLSFYLSIVIKIFGQTPAPIHASLAIFPVIGGIGVFFLGRRFGVSGLVAALIFLSSPVAMISAHTEMVDMPGTCLWIAALALFIYGVDCDKWKLLAASTLFFVASIFTFYQGLSALTIALLYVAVRKRISFKTLAPVVFTVLVFILYLGLFYLRFGRTPYFSYFLPFIGYEKTLLEQARGVTIIAGGTLMFPLVIVFGFIRNWKTALVAFLVAAAIWPWLIVRYEAGSYSFSEVLLIGLLLSAGIVSFYVIAELALNGAIAFWRKQNADILVLSVWVLGIIFYCVVLLSYPSPRYFLPAMPAVAIIFLWLWRSVWQRKVVRILLTGTVIASSVALSIMLSLSFYEYASEARDTAEWVEREFGGHDGYIWFSGELGYAYYMRQKGFRMVPGILWNRYSRTSLPEPPELPAAGDIIVSSGIAGAWLPYPEILPNLREIEIRHTTSDWPVSVWSHDTMSSWNTTLLLPYELRKTPWEIDRIVVWQVVTQPAPLTPEIQEEINLWN